MAVPTSYTEDSFALYLHNVLDGVADVLSFSIDSGSYDEVVNDVLIALDEDDITTIADIRGLRATGRYYVWKKAADKAATIYDFSVDKRSFKRNQIAEHIAERLAAAENDPHATIASNDSATIVTIPLTYTQDPYNTDRYGSFYDRPFDDD